MTLTELRYIVAVQQTKHFGKAAEQCHVSQPSLSVAIKKLEDELGIAIFERSRSSVKVTPIGEQLVHEALQVLDKVSSMHDLVRAKGDPLNQPLKLGAIYTVGPYLFPRLLPSLRSSTPQMPLYVEETYTHSLRKKLRDGELDAIIIALPFDEPDVVTAPLYNEPFCVVLPSGHPLSESQEIDPVTLVGQPLLMLGAEHCFRSQVLELCPALASNTNNGLQNVEGSSLETLKYMVATGLGITVLPRSACAGNLPQQGLVTRPLSGDQTHRTVAIAWRVSFPRPAAIDALRDACGLVSWPQ